MAKFPTYEEMAKNIAEKALDEFLYDGKSIREWMQIIASEDCISRKAVLDAIDSKAWEFCDYLISKGRNDEQEPVSHFADNLREYVREELPSVTPQSKTGHWIKISPAEIYECSECGQNIMTSDICAYKFCHGCGAKMVEPQESEEV